VILASYAAAVDVGLIVTFGGIGLIVNGVIVYIVAQALGERQENRRGTGTETPV
jgi:hypothetical protein